MLIDFFVNFYILQIGLLKQEFIVQISQQNIIFFSFYKIKSTKGLPPIQHIEIFFFNMKKKNDSTEPRTDYLWITKLGLYQVSYKSFKNFDKIYKY